MVPRYLLYATLASLFTAGWIVIILIPSGNFWQGVRGGYAFTLISFFSYGVAATAICAGLFWFETYKVIRNDPL